MSTHLEHRPATLLCGLPRQVLRGLRRDPAYRAPERARLARGGASARGGGRSGESRETLGERQAGKAEQVVIDQLRTSVPADMPQKRLMIAYEPVWAIGTGEVASLDDIATMHNAIASELLKSQGGAGAAKAPVLYGGSVNAENAAAIFALDNVHGGLVGGASLDAEAFGSICESALTEISKS